jgi:hypothetical protein
MRRCWAPNPSVVSLLDGLSHHVVPRRVECVHLDLTQQVAKGARVVVLDVRIEQAKGREQARRWRHDDALHVQCLGHARSEQRPIAAKSEQRVVARVAAAFGGHGLDGTYHIRGGNLVRAVGSVRQGETERRRDLLCERLPRLGGMQWQGTTH